MTTAPQENESKLKIKVFGVGEGGGSAACAIKENNIPGVEFIIGNTPLCAIEYHHSITGGHALQLGEETCKGLGAGANPEVGRLAAEESIDDIRNILKDSDVVFVLAGLGGGTGSGAAPVVARVAQELGAYTIGVVSKPFGYEGKHRAKTAEKSWQALRPHVDSIITIHLDRLLLNKYEKPRFLDAIKICNNLTMMIVRDMVNLINLPSCINPESSMLNGAIELEMRIPKPIIQAENA